MLFRSLGKYKNECGWRATVVGLQGRCKGINRTSLYLPSQAVRVYAIYPPSNTAALCMAIQSASEIMINRNIEHGIWRLIQGRWNSITPQEPSRAWGYMRGFLLCGLLLLDAELSLIFPGSAMVVPRLTNWPIFSPKSVRSASQGLYSTLL